VILTHPQGWSDTPSIEERWVKVYLEEENSFWCAYKCEERGEAVVAFRGGDGGTEDAKNHPGSPAYCFVNALPEEEVLPFRLLSLYRPLT